MNVTEKFQNDRLRNDRALGNRKSDNNNPSTERTTFVALGDPFPVSENSTFASETSVFEFLHEQLLARNSMLSALYAIARPSVRPSVCPSVCPSVTRVDQSKTVERIIEILSPSDRTNILVFRHQRLWRKSDGFTPNVGAKDKGVAKTSNFRPICGYISERVLDRGIVTMEDEYKVLCALSISATFDDLE